MKKTLAIIAIVALLVVSNLTSAFVFRNVTAEREAEWQSYLQYKDDYIKMNDLKGYEAYVSEYNMRSRFGFYPNSRYTPSRDVWLAKYYPPLQGEVYSSANRPYANSLDQPSAVKYYADNNNGRLSGFVLPDTDGIYFDHPDAKVVYGYLSTGGYGYGAYGYTGCGAGNCNNGLDNARFYARVASQVSDDYYVVGYY
ncbi:hypothetical protein JW826_00175 [Candidatus Woesearchaeota archaeon]|nr:hypothetical protein [Candidatus Woesearchaeota archaeon]